MNPTGASFYLRGRAMQSEAVVPNEVLQGPKPISVEIATQDIQMLFAMNTNPDTYMQLILAKLKDAGAPVEGTIQLKLAHGKLFKLKDSMLEEQPAFTYIWLPEGYVEAIANGVGAA